MVIRPSSSQWSISPETIMSHHYRLTRGIKPVVDTSPPYSMYNSPISIHYVPKRSSSADPSKRKQVKPVGQPHHRELADFVNSSKNSLKLPLALTSSYNELAKPTLLANRNYQAPLHRKKEPPIRPISKPKSNNQQYDSQKVKTRKPKVFSEQDDKFFFFKNAVFDAIIERRVYSDKMIVDTVENEIRLWMNYLSKKELDYLKEEIYNDLNIRTPPTVEKSKHISIYANDNVSLDSNESSDNSSEASSDTVQNEEERNGSDKSLSDMSVHSNRQYSSASSTSSTSSSSSTESSSTYSQSSSTSSLSTR